MRIGKWKDSLRESVAAWPGAQSVAGARHARWTPAAQDRSSEQELRGAPLAGQTSSLPACLLSFTPHTALSLPHSGKTMFVFIDVPFSETGTHSPMFPGQPPALCRVDPTCSSNLSPAMAAAGEPHLLRLTCAGRGLLFYACPSPRHHPACRAPGPSFYIDLPLRDSLINVHIPTPGSKLREGGAWAALFMGVPPCARHTAGSTDRVTMARPSLLSL